MKRTLLKGFLTGLMMLGFYINAAAYPIADYEDTVDTFDYQNSSSTISWDFKIDDWGSSAFRNGWIVFDFDLQSKSSLAEFSFKLSDVDDVFEKKININNDNANWSVNLNSASADFRNNFNGTIWAQLTSTEGSFDFNSATLLVNVFGNSTHPIGSNEAIVNPEPATMLLVGFGLLGLVGLSRRKSNH